MELKRLVDFIALAEELHFERAAARVGTDQSGLSKRMRSLERELGVKLFSRTTRGTTIAPAGRAYLPYARCIVGKLEQARRAAREAEAGARVALRVGVCDEVPVKKLARVLAEYRSREPGVDLELIDRSCAALIQDLEIGVIDVGLSLGWANNPALRVAQLWQDRACVMLPAKHRLAQLSRVAMEDIVEEQVIVSHRQCNCGARFEIDGFIRAVKEHARIEGAANLNVLRALVSAGHGIGLVSGAQAEAIQDTEVVQRSLAERTFTFTTYVLQRRDDESVFASKFFDLARRLARDT